MDIQIIGSGSSGNAYIISDGKTRIMLDCGLPIRKLQNATGYSVSSIDGCLISHEHQDHCKAHRDLIKMGIDVFTRAETIAHLGVKGHRYHAVKTAEQFSIGTFDIVAFDLVHDVPNIGFLIYSTETKGKAVYITDTQYIPVRFNGITHWLIEANNDDEIMGENVDSGILNRNLKYRIQQNHMNINTVLDVFKANDMSNTEQIFLLHLSNDNSNAEEFREKVEKMTGAYVVVC